MIIFNTGIRDKGAGSSIVPISTETREELDLTILTATGEAPFSELMQAMESFYTGSPTANLIWDCSQVTEINILNRELQTIVQYAKKHSDKRAGGQTALVANSSLKFGLARMTSIFAELVGLPWEMKIFKNLDAAMAWIKERRQAEAQIKN